jgi:hypothetical protein
MAIYENLNLLPITVPTTEAATQKKTLGGAKRKDKFMQYNARQSRPIS